MKRIKRLLAVLLLVVLTFSFTFLGCGTEKEDDNSNGRLCTLAEAYEARKITHEDLLSIAYYANSAIYNSEIDKNFEPQCKMWLSPKTFLKIRQSVADMIRDLRGVTITADFYSIDYYGCYRGNYVFFYWMESDGAFPGIVIYQEEIDDVVFQFFCHEYGRTIYVWTEE